MIANYHTHTPRCNHADGAERQYVERALEAGLTILGFSDHAPYLFPGFHDSWFRMTPEALPDYVQTVLSLREEYHGRIQIPLGLELEYYPGLLPKTLPILRDLPLDYLLLGQHFTNNEYDGHYAGTATGDSAILTRYCDQCIEALQTGLFTYLAHPDLIHFRGSDNLYRQQMRRLCRESASCGIPLEINILGLLKNRHYPDLRFWEIAGEENCAVILGRDAHTPEQLTDTDCLGRAEQIVSNFGLRLLETASLRPIR